MFEPALLEEIKRRTPEIEAARQLPADLVGRLMRTGVFRLCVPRSLNGLEAEPAALLRAIETVATSDGSAGWCVMIGATSAMTAAYLDPATAGEIYGDPDVVTGGVFAPKGKAAIDGDDYRVSGRWQWASGSSHCRWLMGGCAVTEGSKPRLLEGGMPEARMVLFPASEAVIHDTWHSSGLCGTGSNDMEVGDLLVPRRRSASIATDKPVENGALYAFPIFGLLALGIAAVGLGLARRAMQELAALAGGKVPTGGQRALIERPATQADYARAEATLRSARGFYFEAVAEAWDRAQAEGVIPTDQRARLRLAATHATEASARVVDVMYNLGGGTSVYRDSALQRCFRDVHVVTQHMMVAPATWELAGRALLGVKGDLSML
ncbi:MAG: acyl-CoA dehydrogenase family protein [Reyranellaceae bacterium]